MKRIQLIELVLAVGLALVGYPSAQGGQQARPCPQPRVFNEVPGMPLDQFQLTVYNLRRDAARWKKTLARIDPNTLSEQLPLDKRIRELLGDVDKALSDMDRSAAIIIQCPNVAETVATTFDLTALSEDLVNISDLLALARNSKDAVKTPNSSPALSTSAERWQQIVNDVASEVFPFREGLKSYTFHLSQTIDTQLKR